MAVNTEPTVAKTSSDIEKTGHAENGDTAAAAYVPNSDEEYNVTFKTWIVVGVGRSSQPRPKTDDRDPRPVLWYLLLDRPRPQRRTGWRCHAVRRPEPGGMVHSCVYHDCDTGIHASRSPSVVNSF